MNTSSNFQKPLVVFQREGEEPHVPVVYWNDVAVLSDNPWMQPLQIQDIARKFDHDGHPILRAVGGAVVGSIFGPVGTVLGVLVGLISTPVSPLERIPRLQCKQCRNKFRYWCRQGNLFYCPHCLLPYRFGRSIRKGG